MFPKGISAYHKAQESSRKQVHKVFRVQCMKSCLNKSSSLISRCGSRGDRYREVSRGESRYVWLESDRIGLL